ncbi:MAG: helix-turn-helix transcriptional regulator [Bdellovibrionales bacterium]
MSLTLIYLLAKGVRIAAAIQCGIMAYWVLRRRGRTTRSWILVGFAIAVMGYLLTPLPFNLGGPLWLQMLALFLAYSSPVFIWFATMALFRDEMKVGGLHLFAWAASEVICFSTLLGFPTSTFFYSGVNGFIGSFFKTAFPQTVTLFFVGLSLREAQGSDRMDLVNERIRFRILFVRAMAAVSLLVISTEMYMKAVLKVSQYLDLMTSCLVFMVIYSLDHFIRTDENILPQAPDQEGLKTPVVPAAWPDPDFNEKFKAHFEQRKVFLRPTLTVEGLACVLDVPEYKLRQFINKTLGFRNFNQFLNHYRIQEAMGILAKPEGKKMPIYNLAMELGYGSIVSFNRAFKNTTGVTPSRYREAANPAKGNEHRVHRL